MWQITKNKDWQYLHDTFDWVKDMDSVPQDKRYHAEGNVAIHTQMVLEAIEKLSEFQELDAQSKEILWTSGLMHDIEKRSTTILETDGSITSKNHAKRGEFSVREILYCQLPTPFAIREQIAKLVRYHGLPLWIFEKSNPKKSLLQISLEVNTQWLYILAKADVLGRICSDQHELLYRIELFKELCIENECWGKPKRFPSSTARFEYFNKEERFVDYLPFEDFKTEVIILSGLPGTGKDTFIKKNLCDLPIICLDDIREELKVKTKDMRGNGQVIQLAKENAKSYLRNQTGFIWNATNVTRQTREQLINLFAEYKAKITIIYLEVPYQTQQKQNRNREKVVPQSAVQRMIEKLEIPQVWEAHEVRYYFD